MPYPESRILDALTPTVYLPEVEVVGKNLFSGPALNDDDDIYYISEPTILNPNSKNSDRVYTYNPYTGLHPVVNKKEINPYTRVHMDLMDNRKQNGKYMSNGSYTSLNGHVSRFVRLPRPIWEYNIDYMSNKYSKESKKPIMFRTKFQEGGQIDQQQQALVQFIQGIAQVAQVDPLQVMQLAQQEPERLETAVQVFQQTQDIQQAAQAFFQKEVLSAKKGAKLNYLKKLSGKCPEGYELRYFKVGGKTPTVCSKCVAKKQKGDEVEEAKCGSKMKKKKGCGGFKLRKAQNGINLNKDGGSLNRIPFKLPGGVVSKINNAIYGLKTWADITDHRLSDQGTVTTQNGVNRTIWRNDLGEPIDTNYVSEKYPILSRDASKRIYDTGEDPVSKVFRSIKKIGKRLMNPRYFFNNGCSLKGIPFKLYGGMFGNFAAPSEIFSYNPNAKLWKIPNDLQIKPIELEKKEKLDNWEFWKSIYDKQRQLNKLNDSYSFYKF